MSSPKIIDKTKNILKTGNNILKSIEKTLNAANEDDEDNKSPKEDSKKDRHDDARKSIDKQKKETDKKHSKDNEQEDEEEEEDEAGEKGNKKKAEKHDEGKESTGKTSKKKKDVQDEEKESPKLNKKKDVQDEEKESPKSNKKKNTKTVEEEEHGKTTKKRKEKSDNEEDEDSGTKEIDYNETTILDSRIHQSEFDSSLVRHEDTEDFIDNLLATSPGHNKKDFGLHENKDHRKTFITDQKAMKLPDESREEARPDPWKIYDILIPAGKPAKLVRIFDPKSEDLRVSQIVDKLKFIEPRPVIILAGAMTERARGKFLAGVCRAAYRTDAVIIDSGVGSGIEQFCIRKGILMKFIEEVTLIGVAPEAEVVFPKLNPTERPTNELSNGHSHFFILGDKQKKYKWEDETQIKIELAERIATGRSKYGPKNHCRVVTLILGDNQNCSEEILLVYLVIIVKSQKHKWAIVMAEGSEMVTEILKYKKKEVNYLKNNKLRDFVRTAKYYTVKENSEEVASLIHLLLTVSFD